MRGPCIRNHWEGAEGATVTAINDGLGSGRTACQGLRGRCRRLVGAVVMGSWVRADLFASV